MVKGRILRLRGLPWSADDREVRQFLEEHPPVDVYLRKRGGKSTGEAYVEFESAEQAAAAQADRNHKNLDNRYIEIFATDAESMEALRGETEEHDTGWVVRLRGLPFSATADDVLQLFEGLEIVGGTSGVQFPWGRDNRPIGEAYVEFASDEAQNEAMLRDRKEMGQRYIEVFKSTKADMISRSGGMRRSEPGGGDWTPYGARMRGRGRMSEGGGRDQEYGLQYMALPAHMGPGGMADGSTLRLRGLPYSATQEEIIEFFEGYNVTPEQVHIMTRPGRDGQLQGTGMAYVQFSSPAEAESARADRHNKSMGSRYIECLPMWPLPRAPLQQAALPGPIAMPAGPRLFPPRGMSLAGIPGPNGMPASVGPRPMMPLAFQFDQQPQAGPRARSAGQLPFGIRPQPPPPLGMPGGQPFEARPGRPTGTPTGLGGVPPPPISRLQPKGGWRGPGRSSSPVPPMQVSSSAGGQGQLTPVDYQQQMLMQHQYLMHQHLMHQQQAMGMRHSGWGMPGGGIPHMGGPFVAAFGAAPIGPSHTLQRPPPHATRPLFSSGPPTNQIGPSQDTAPSLHPDMSPADRQPGAHSAKPNLSLPAAPSGLSSHAFRMQPGQAVAPGVSPASSLQSEMQSLALGSRSQSTASRTTSGAIAPAQPPTLHAGLPASSTSQVSEH